MTYVMVTSTHARCVRAHRNFLTKCYENGLARYKKHENMVRPIYGTLNNKAFVVKCYKGRQTCSYELKNGSIDFTNWPISDLRERHATIL